MTTSETDNLPDVVDTLTENTPGLSTSSSKPFTPPAEDSPGWTEVGATDPASIAQHNWDAVPTLVGKLTEVLTEGFKDGDGEVEIPVFVFDVGTKLTKVHPMDGPQDFLLEIRPGDTVMIRSLGVQEGGTRVFRTFKHG